MEKKNITMRKLAVENIRKRSFRSFALIILIVVFSFSLFFGTVMSVSLSRGMESLSHRLGADVMVVPEGYDARIDSVLLSGKPNTFSLPKGTLDKVKKIKGVEKVTGQTYIATLKASCCSYPLQIIGIDFDTDFLVKPWLDRSLNKKLGYGELVIGHRVSGEVGQSLKLFGKEYKIVGKLEQTGMGFDSSVFVTKDTARALSKEVEERIGKPLKGNKSLYSTIMIKVKPGYESELVAKEITNKYADDGIYGMYSKKFVNKISTNLSLVSRYIGIILAIIWILAVLVIALIFTLTLSERKKEIAILRTLGASKKKLVEITLTEVGIIALYGSVIGIVLAAVGILVVAPVMAERVQLPFLLPSIWFIIFAGLGAFVISIATAILSSLYSAIKASKAEIYTIMREND